MMFLLLFAACTAQQGKVEPEVLSVEPLVDYHFLGGYTGRGEGGFYVIAGDVEAVRQELMSILAGSPPRSRFSRDENLNLVVFRGVFPTGGYGIKIDGVERTGNEFVVHATYTNPEKGAIVTQAFTQPTAVVPLGKLPPGAYSAELYVRRGGEEELYKRIEFVVE